MGDNKQYSRCQPVGGKIDGKERPSLFERFEEPYKSRKILSTAGGPRKKPGVGKLVVPSPPQNRGRAETK